MKRVKEEKIDKIGSYSKNNLYPSLFEIGLKDYLSERGNGDILKEELMIKLDSFVEKLPSEQKKRLKEKIYRKNKETHVQKNNMLHEISIACAFYDNVSFLSEQPNKKTPDFLSNGVYVEVKTINYSEEEQERFKILRREKYLSIDPRINKDKEKQLKKKIIETLNKKFRDCIKIAKEQLGINGGHIWIVYAIDRPPNFHVDMREKIKNNFDRITEELSPELNNLKITVNNIPFESLREEIKKECK